MVPASGATGIGAPVALPQRLQRLVGVFAPGGRFAAFAAFLALAAQQGGVLMMSAMAFFLLGRQDYGRTASALAFLNIFVALGSASSPVMVYRFVLMRADSPAAIYRIVRFARRAVLCSGLTAVLTVAALLWLFPGSGYLKSIVPLDIVAALMFLLMSVLASYQQGYVLARGEMMPLLVVNTVILAVTIPVGWLLIGRLGYTGYFAALTLPLVIRSSVLYLREPRGVGDDGTRFDWRNAFVGFMVPATAASFTSFPAYWLATEVLFRSPGGAAALGLITLGISLKQAPLLLATSLVSSSGRPVFRAFAERSPDMVKLHRDFFKRTIAPLLGAAAAIALIGGLAIAASGRGTYVHDIAIVAAALGAVLAAETFNAFIYMPFTMGGAMWQSLFGIALPRDISFVAVASAVIPLMGWPGFLVGLIALNTIGVLLTILVGRRNPALRPFYSFRPTAAAAGDTP